MVSTDMVGAEEAALFAWEALTGTLEDIQTPRENFQFLSRAVFSGKCYEQNKEIPCFPPYQSSHQVL